MKDFSDKWGDTLQFTLKNVRDLDGSLVTDFSSWDLWLTIKTSADDADPGIVQKQKSAGGWTVSGGTAQTEISASENRSLFLPDTAYYYDVQGKNAAGKIRTLEEGYITLTKDATKALS